MGRERFTSRAGPVDASGNPIVVQFAVNDTPVTKKDTSFVVGDSPATFDANTALGPYF